MTSAPPGPRLWRAPAKVNLTLHILGRRADGWHELDSVVAFAGCCDVLSFEPGETLGLTVEGPTAEMAGRDEDNLVLRAARQLGNRVPGLRVGRFGLLKRLPVAAGLGGGSARLRRTQTGFVRSYALSMLGGSVAVLAVLLAVRFS